MKPALMSAMGHKQTLEQASEMSALPTKADMRLAVQKCPLCAINGHGGFSAECGKFLCQQC